MMLNTRGASDDTGAPSLIEIAGGAGACGTCDAAACAAFVG
jgi:hypothetical protein